MALTNNKNVLTWVKEMEDLMTPDKVVWIDGSEEQLKALREEAFSTGEMQPLNEELLPGCMLHHTAKNDAARVEDRTFICTKNKEDAAPINNWMETSEMKAKLIPMYTGVMKGRTMYVIPYCMGPIGSPFSKVGVEVTDSIYVVLNMDGRLYAINPENGFFGVAPGTNEKSNPNALHTTMKNTIFTNVAHNLDNNTVWWEGLDKNPPENAEEWTGMKVNGKEYVAAGNKLAHPNSRFTAPAVNCPCLSKEFNNPNGVPVTAMVFGGRRAKTAPLVFQSFDWNHGVYVGSAMASETTAAAAGAVGVVRRDPMAMRPFCGYNMGDYFAHWIEMGKKLGDKAPKIFHVNWFRTDDEGHFIWPGFGDNMRVLMWMLARCRGEVDAVETPIGYVPKAEDINIDGLDGITLDTVKGLLDVDKKLWMEDANGVEALYDEIGARVPAELRKQLADLKARLA